MEDRALPTLSRLAMQVGSGEIAREAEALAERLREGRFYVACIGQFKRGKSTLVNALVEEPVLPVGVVPVTAAITVVRHGERLAARVRFGARDWEECDPRDLPTYVSEEHNPGNEKGVSGVEVFVPSPLLESGLCLVDTPGISSVSAAGTAATRAFVPHIDAALVVLGADPPISGDELRLVQAIARDVDELVVVLNKADRLSETEREEAIRFSHRVLAEGLGKPVGPIFRVSATERLAAEGPRRDWDALVDRLRRLARQSGAELVHLAEERGTVSLVDRLLAELDEQEAALQRPLDESREHVERLRLAVAEAERSLDDLGHRLGAVQDRLYRVFVEERERFFGEALPAARQELLTDLRLDGPRGPALRERAIDLALELARRWLDRWRQEQEPRAEALYTEAVGRFVELVEGLRRTLAAVPGLEGLRRPGTETGFTARTHLRYTEMLTVAPSSLLVRLLDLVRLPQARVRALEHDTAHYLARLLEVNSARVANDFQDRVVESRRRLEQELRQHLRELSASAERALAEARQLQAAGASAVAARLESLRARRREAETLRPVRPPAQSAPREI